MSAGQREYDELQLRIERAEGGYRVLALAPDGRRGRGSFAPPVSDTELDDFVTRVGLVKRSRGRNVTADIEEFGAKLYEALVHDEVAAVFQAADTAAADRDRGLRVTLVLSGAPELMRLPWEYLYRRPRFLAQSARTPVVRSLDCPTARRPRAVVLPLRILGIASAPSGYERLDAAQERDRLERAVSRLRTDGLVSLEWLPTPTLQALADRITEPDDIHVLHYIGHGAYDEATEAGNLVFEDARGRADDVSGHDLGAMLQDEDSLRLVVLNSCEGARTSHVDPFSGVATSLVEFDIPAVVGMQFEITDEAAIAFADALYRALAQGLHIDAAMGPARRAIVAARRRAEFATPVLFLRGSDARLFEVQTVTQPALTISSPDLETPILLTGVDLTSPTGLLAGVQAVVVPVARTLGPTPRGVIVQSEHQTDVSFDSLDVARSVVLGDPVALIGASIIREAMERIRESIGDGAARTALIAGTLIERLCKQPSLERRASLLSRELDSTLPVAKDTLRSLAQEVRFKEQVASVASFFTADTPAGQIIAEAVEQVGKEGAIIVERNRAFGLELQWTEGMCFDEGYVSAEYVTDVERMAAVLHHPFILIIDSTLNAVEQLSPLFNRVMQTGRPLAVFANDFDGRALEALLDNSLDKFTSVAVRAPGLGVHRRAFLQDIAVMTGGHVINEVCPSLKKVSLEQLGSARKIIVTKDETTIIEPAGNRDEIMSRIHSIRDEILNSDSDDDRLVRQETLAKLAAGVAIIKVPGTTEAEFTDRTRLMQSALRIVSAAIQDGIVPGGGTALARVSRELRDRFDHEASSGGRLPEAVCIEADVQLALAAALEAPIRQLAANSNVPDIGELVRKVGQGTGFSGFSVLNGDVSDLDELGVLEPLRVDRLAVETAIGAAQAFLARL